MVQWTIADLRTLLTIRASILCDEDMFIGANRRDTTMRPLNILEFRKVTRYARKIVQCITTYQMITWVCTHGHFKSRVHAAATSYISQRHTHITLRLKHQAYARQKVDSLPEGPKSLSLCMQSGIPPKTLSHWPITQKSDANGPSTPIFLAFSAAEDDIGGGGGVLISPLFGGEVVVVVSAALAARRRCWWRSTQEIATRASMVMIVCLSLWLLVEFW